MYPGASIRSALHGGFGIGISMKAWHGLPVWPSNLKFGMYSDFLPYDPKPKTPQQLASNWMGFRLEAIFLIGFFPRN